MWLQRRHHRRKNYLKTNLKKKKHYAKSKGWDLSPNSFFVPVNIISAIMPRQEQSHSNTNVGVRFFYFCIKGVAGFVVPTQKIEYTQTHYLNQKRNKFGDFCK